MGIGHPLGINQCTNQVRSVYPLIYSTPFINTYGKSGLCGSVQLHCSIGHVKSNLTLPIELFFTNLGGCYERYTNFGGKSGGRRYSDLDLTGVCR